MSAFTEEMAKCRNDSYDGCLTHDCYPDMACMKPQCPHCGKHYCADCGEWLGAEWGEIVPSRMRAEVVRNDKVIIIHQICMKEGDTIA